jgi:hypothetical protein
MQNNSVDEPGFIDTSPQPDIKDEQDLVIQDSTAAKVSVLGKAATVERATSR